MLWFDEFFLLLDISSAGICQRLGIMIWRKNCAPVNSFGAKILARIFKITRYDFTSFFFCLILQTGRIDGYINRYTIWSDLEIAQVEIIRQIKAGQNLHKICCCCFTKKKFWQNFSLPVSGYITGAGIRQRLGVGRAQGGLPSHGGEGPNLRYLSHLPRTRFNETFQNSRSYNGQFSDDPRRSLCQRHSLP